MPLVDENYSNYFEGERQQQWYELGAIGKATNIVDVCAALPVQSVLDIGAGSGAVLNRLANDAFPRAKDIRWCAAEISESGLEVMRRRFAGRDNVSVSSFDGRALPFADDSFDLAILSHVVEHLEHPRAALYEARRVARHVYVEVPLEATFAVQRQRGDFQWDDTGHINYYNRHTFRRLLQTSGLRVEKLQLFPGSAAVIRAHGDRWPTARHLVRRGLLSVAPGLAQALFVYHCGALCSRGEKLPIAQ